MISDPQSQVNTHYLRKVRSSTASTQCSSRSMQRGGRHVNLDFQILSDIALQIDPTGHFLLAPSSADPIEAPPDWHCHKFGTNSYISGSRLAESARNC